MTDDRTRTDPNSDRDTCGDTLASEGPVLWRAGAALPVRAMSRYRFFGECARGGLGVVLDAEDLETGRRVAIKQPLDAAPWLEPRFRREALITAQLEHPNVVPVYDVGRRDDTGELFYAMKMIRGRSLRQAIREADDLEQRLGLLPFVVAAAEGVAFAHAKGIIHRDLKPSNVLVGEFGETVVIDWGLAKILDPASPAYDAAEGTSGAREEVSADDALTRTGHVLGTPAYMPPEQAAGDDVDERADVYALGAMLYQVLTGRAPRAGSDRSQPFDEVPVAPVQEVEPRVPPELAAIVNRAMAPEPADRYPNAGAAVDDLRRFQRGQLIAAHRYSRRELARRWVARNRGRLLVASLLITSSVAVGALLVTREADPAAACDAADGELAGVWDDGRRKQLADAIAAVGGPGADNVLAKTVSVLDAYARDWREMSVASCRATYARRAQSERVFELRRRCLERRKTEVAELVGVLVDASDLSTMISAAQSLPPVTYCANERALSSARPPPADAAGRERFEAAFRSLAKAKAFEDTGQYAEGVALARRVYDDAVGTDFVAVRAVAALRLGWLLTYTGQFEEARTMLLQAVELGSAAGDDETVARAWSQAVFLVAQHFLRPGDARLMIPAARAALIRAGNPPLVEAQLELNLGTVDYFDQNYEGARAHYARALEMFRAAGGPDYYKVSWGLNNVAMAQTALGDARGAEQALLEAIALKLRLFGEGHPDVSLSRLHLAILLESVGRYDEALAITTQIKEDLLRVFGPDHPRVAEPYFVAGRALVGLGRHEQAREELSYAFRVFQSVSDGDNLMIANLLIVRARSYRATGELDAAERDLVAALDVLERAHGAEHAAVALALEPLADLALARNRAARAVELARRAVRLTPTSDAEAGSRGARRFVLARALWAAGDRAEALAQARTARAELAGADDAPRLSEVADDGDARARVEAWLAERDRGTPSR